MCSLWVYIFGPIKCEQQGNYPSGCFIQLASDTNISHATWVTTLLLKQPIFFSVIHYTMYVQLKWLKRSSVCNVLWSYISYVLSLQTAQQCQSASSSKGEREKSIFPKRLAPNTTILASFSWRTWLELRSIIWNAGIEKMLSVSTQRSSMSGSHEGESSRWPGKHWLRSCVMLNFILLLVTLKQLSHCNLADRQNLMC